MLHENQCNPALNLLTLDDNLYVHTYVLRAVLSTLLEKISNIKLVFVVMSL